VALVVVVVAHLAIMNGNLGTARDVSWIDPQKGRTGQGDARRARARSFSAVVATLRDVTTLRDVAHGTDFGALRSWMEISARRATFRESIRKAVAHIKAMLGELAPDPWQQSPQRYVTSLTTLTLGA
jgi:hypothetical protein